MDISTLSLPLRKDRSRLFTARPSISSVNISYETAEAQLEPSSDRRRGSSSSSYSPSSTPSAARHAPQLAAADPASSSPSSPSPSSLSRPVPARPVPALSVQTEPFESSSEHSPQSTHAFPPKKLSVSPSTSSLGSGGGGGVNGSSGGNGGGGSSGLHDDGSGSSSSERATRESRSASRSSFSLASAECQQFVASLKEPKYAKPLTSDEIAWIFQDFYLKLEEELLGSENELLTAEEHESREHIRRNIGSIMDRAEKAVTSGELHAKLFALDASHDARLQPRINLIRTNSDASSRFAERLGSAEIAALRPDDERVVLRYLGRLARETSPKAKLSALVKAHRALDGGAGRDADTVFPLFVWCLIRSELGDWWQNFMYMSKFRRASELSGQAAYCLTNFEAAIHFVEQFTVTAAPGDDDELELLHRPLRNPRQRSASQSSKSSSSLAASLSQRVGDTLQSYRSMLQARRPVPLVEQRFLTADADALTLADVRVLLREYKRLAQALMDDDRN